ncbi:class I SAM-dependent methyltransferase [Zhihengliuella halotolerans]|uniref:16S rRNA (Guanine1207-N2)-methyltransferase n=1 Tax=Zhihengliuella halotolerans TaxID=370736 RepID=A0A4Q8AAS1_9MICC|nr:class I SAM-dependent methyltransferase [Zhihengliuella halotolerans]RZU61217.1 16S rRNA (guanine1207-N2)-methyltransferase [Zhihengliuella halotolerans]
MSGQDRAPLFAALRRWPDVEADNLQAHDSADDLLLDIATTTLADAATLRGEEVAVIGDRYGALTLGLAAAGVTGHRVHTDPLASQLAIDANAQRLGLSDTFRHIQPSADGSLESLGRDLLDGIRLVVMQLPRSLDELRDWARLVATFADDDVTLLAGGRVKHMSRSMNDVLGESFSSVDASLARRKARALTASGAVRPAPGPPVPDTASYDVGLNRELILTATGGTFGGAKLDPGTRLLLPALAQARTADLAIDLGCGNGTLAAFLAVSRPALKVLACDQSAAAILSTRSTAAANGVADRVSAVRDDALSGQPEGSADLIVLNPPFHMGNTVHAGIALKLFADAGRVLADGGELWCVWNSHLRYRGQLERLVGPTRQVDRDPRFTVTVSRRTRH